MPEAALGSASSSSSISMTVLAFDAHELSRFLLCSRLNAARLGVFCRARDRRSPSGFSPTIAHPSATPLPRGRSNARLPPFANSAAWLGRSSQSPSAVDLRRSQPGARSQLGALLRSYPWVASRALRAAESAPAAEEVGEGPLLSSVPQSSSGRKAGLERSFVCVSSKPCCCRIHICQYRPSCAVRFVNMCWHLVMVPSCVPHRRSVLASSHGTVSCATAFEYSLFVLRMSASCQHHWDAYPVGLASLRRT